MFTTSIILICWCVSIFTQALLLQDLRWDPRAERQTKTATLTGQILNQMTPIRGAKSLNMKYWLYSTQNSKRYIDSLSKQKRFQKANLICCNLYRKLKHESESVKVELEKVFGSNVELEEVERESEEQENATETTAIVLGVLLALCFVALITLAVVYVIK